MQLSLPLPQSSPPASVPVHQAAGCVYEGTPVPMARLHTGDTISSWQAQFLETMGFTFVDVRPS